ncbi:unnamed protein product [Sphagnum tenellum]
MAGWNDDGRLWYLQQRGTTTNSAADYRVEPQESIEWAALEQLLHGQADRQQVLENALATSKQDTAQLLLHIKERIERVGLVLPTVEVRFEKLSVSADVYVGDRAQPTLINFTRDIFEACLASCKLLRPNNKRPLSILHGISGVIKPGRMTLLLGPPGAGKTTLLLALSGKLSEKDLREAGIITYNGHLLNEFKPQRTAAYISQNDDHIGELTVRETLDFAARCQGVGPRFELLEELRRRERELNIQPDPHIDAFMKGTAMQGMRHSLSTDYILKVLGLEICADVPVGSDMLRGISGGQKKRVTTGEMVVGPTKTLFMDHISTGLDSSTTFQIVRSTGDFVHLMQGTVLMALLQPAPETFELFDDIILLAEGHIMYMGPRESSLAFFESLGFKLPDRKGIADFLQEVTSKKDQEQYWGDPTRPYEFVSVPQIAKFFQDYKIGQEMMEYLSVPFDRAKNHPAALVKVKYALSRWELFKACTGREWLLIKRNKFLYVFRTVQVALLATICSTLFPRTRIHPVDEQNGYLYMSTLFFALIHMMFNAFTEMALTVYRLPVFYKQRDNLFYPAWAFCVPGWIMRIPYSAVEALIWSCIVYFVVGLAPEAFRFFRYMLLLFLMHQMAIGLFRTIGALGRTMVIANTFGSFALLILFVLGGFILSKANIPDWWIWGFWISPLSYAQNAIAVNEFLAKRWQVTSPNAPVPLSYSILTSKGMFTEAYWYGIGALVLFAYTCLFNFTLVCALKYLQPLGQPQATVSEEAFNGKTGTSNSGNTTSVTITDYAAIQLAVPASQQQPQGQKGMILPFQPLALTFDNMSYFVDMPAEMKAQGLTSERLQLLRSISGAFRPGVLTALMGVSGAGKTTLMDVLAGRKTGGYIEGTIKVAGYTKVQKTFARISGYVEQTDIHSPQVTVYESLLYSSWLRLPREVNSMRRKLFVEEVMELVELKTLQNALVGLPGSTGLSTEQRKRLTIAVELVANPSVIFMDEPTSGLDARAAAIVMRTVRNTVDTGRTVVCTIHQPSINIFEAFDELLLVKRGGEVIYAGPLGQFSQELIAYFSQFPGIPPIKAGYNPATWMLEITTPAMESQLDRNFALLYANSELYKVNANTIRELSTPKPGSEDLSFPTQFSQPSAVQFKACLWKQNLTYWRSPYYNAVRFFFTVVVAVLFGSIFWQLGDKRATQQDVFNVMGVLYASVLFLGVNNASSVQPVVSVERSVFYRERAAGMYSPLSYACAQALIEVPYVFCQTIVYGVITYSMIHFEWTAAKFFWYILFMFLTFTYFTMYGMMAVGLTASQQLAAVTSSGFYSLWNLFSGFLIPKAKMPGWWVWYYWICPVAWTLYGLITSQLGDVNTPILAAGFSSQIAVKDFVLGYLGYKYDWLGLVVVVCFVFMGIFWVAFAFAIKFLNFQTR